MTGGAVCGQECLWEGIVEADAACACALPLHALCGVRPHEQVGGGRQIKILISWPRVPGHLPALPLSPPRPYFKQLHFRVGVRKHNSQQKPINYIKNSIERQ